MLDLPPGGILGLVIPDDCGLKSAFYDPNTIWLCPAVFGLNVGIFELNSSFLFFLIWTFLFS